jgi:hypothetical protein
VACSQVAPAPVLMRLHHCNVQNEPRKLLHLRIGVRSEVSQASNVLGRDVALVQEYVEIVHVLVSIALRARLSLTVRHDARAAEHLSRSSAAADATEVIHLS